MVCAVVASSVLAGQGSGTVEITSAVKVFIAKDTPRLLVAFQYDFAGRQTVHIKGLGTVSASGEFEYLTREPTLQVREAPDGPILAEVPLKETIIVAAKAPLDRVPGEHEFPATFQSDTWASPNPMRDRMNTVLRKYFSYMPREENSVNYTVTTFTPLRVEELPRGATAQLALMISFPHDAATGKYLFHVHSLVHEGRVLSDDTRPTSNENIWRAAHGFVDELIKEIKAGNQGRP